MKVHGERSTCNLLFSLGLVSASSKALLRSSFNALFSCSSCSLFLLSRKMVSFRAFTFTVFSPLKKI